MIETLLYLSLLHIFALELHLAQAFYLYSNHFALIVLLLIYVLMLFLSLRILVQVIPLHLPAGDTSTERTVHIDGTEEQVEIAKQLVIEVTSEVRILSIVVYIPDIRNCFVVSCFIFLILGCLWLILLIILFNVFPCFVLKILFLLLLCWPTLITLLC